MTPRPPWNELFFYRYGYTIVRAYNSSVLTWEWIESNTSKVRDRVVLTQKDLNIPWTTAEDSTPTGDSSGSSQSPLLNTQQIIIIACVGGFVVLLGEIYPF